MSATPEVKDIVGYDPQKLLPDLTPKFDVEKMMLVLHRAALWSKIMPMGRRRFNKYTKRVYRTTAIAGMKFTDTHVHVLHPTKGWRVIRKKRLGMADD